MDITLRVAADILGCSRQAVSQRLKALSMGPLDEQVLVQLAAVAQMKGRRPTSPEAWARRESIVRRRLAVANTNIPLMLDAYEAGNAIETLQHLRAEILGIVNPA